METFEATAVGPQAGARITVRVGCEFQLCCEVPTPAVVMVRPLDEGDRRLAKEDWLVRPASHSRETTDALGNRIRRLVLPAGECTLRYDAAVSARRLDATTPTGPQPSSHPTIYPTTC